MLETASSEDTEVKTCCVVVFEWTAPTVSPMEKHANRIFIADNIVTVTDNVSNTITKSALILNFRVPLYMSTTYTEYFYFKLVFLAPSKINFHCNYCNIHQPQYVQQ